MTVEQLTTLRDTLQAAWTARLTQPTKVSGTGRSAEYQQKASEIKRELEAVIAELARRAGTSAPRKPIYLVG